MPFLLSSSRKWDLDTVKFILCIYDDVNNNNNYFYHYYYIILTVVTTSNLF